MSQTVEPDSRRFGAIEALSSEAKTLATDVRNTNQFLERLVAHDLLPDALKVLAECLAVRDAIWWGCLCVRRSGAPSRPARDELSLKAAARWCADPVETRRRDAESSIGADALETPAGCLAWAVSATGNRVTFPGLPAMPPQPSMARRAISGAVLMAATDEKLRGECVAMGMQVLDGRYLWDAVRTHKS